MRVSGLLDARFHPKSALADFGSYSASEIGNTRFHPKSALADFGSY